MASLHKLFIWLSPTFPVGAFAYSHGLEWAQHAGLVCDETSLQDWLEDLITHGSWHNDAVIFAAASDAIKIRFLSHQGQTLPQISALSLALCASKERYQETVQQGNALLAAARSAWPCDTLELLAGDVTYPVALALLCAGHDLEKTEVLLPYGLAFAQNLVSASIRLGIIGQTAGQKILAALTPIVEIRAQKAANSTLDDIHNSAFMADFASMQHESQYTRIFRS